MRRRTKWTLRREGEEEEGEGESGQGGWRGSRGSGGQERMRLTSGRERINEMQRAGAEGRRKKCSALMCGSATSYHTREEEEEEVEDGDEDVL